jgi:hypothetical protein
MVVEPYLWFVETVIEVTTERDATAVVLVKAEQIANLVTASEVQSPTLDGEAQRNWTRRAEIDTGQPPGILTLE